jgi:hypothetical protein
VGKGKKNAMRRKEDNEVMQGLKELVEQLPPDLQQEVRDFVEFLMEKRVTKQKGNLKLDWRGALRDMRDKYTSVELQHKVLQWWGD